MQTTNSRNSQNQCNDMEYVVYNSCMFIISNKEFFLLGEIFRDNFEIAHEFCPIYKSKDSKSAPNDY